MRIICPAAEKGVEHLRIEMLAAAFFEDLEAFLQRKRRLVGPLAAQGVEHVGHGGDAALDRNVLAGQAQRVARSVPCLVVADGDDRGQRQDRRIGRFQQPRAQLGVAAQDVHLVIAAGSG